MRALQKSLPANSYALDFSQVEYEELFSMLLSVHSKDELLQKKGAIKKAICDHFAYSFQEITLSVLESGIVVKKTFIDPKRDEKFDRLIHRLNLLLIEIVDNPNQYRQAGVLWTIPDRLRKEMFALFDSLKMGDYQRREYIRQQLETVFELDEKDIILFLLNRIYIREYVPPRTFPEGEERRFAGEPPEKLQDIFENTFPEGLWEDIEYCLPTVHENELNFSIIDNRTFTQKFIQSYRSIIDIILLEYLEGIDQQLLEGLTGYVLRLYFDRILIYTAKDLLSFVEERDLNAEDFIKYYTDDVIIDSNGKKIQKHAIVDSRQQKWNHSAIVSVLVQFKQANKRAELQEEKIAQAKKRAEEAKFAVASGQAEHDRTKSLLDNIKGLVTECKMKIQQARQNDKSRLPDLQAELAILIDEQKEASDNYIYSARYYNNKTTEMNNWEKQFDSATKLIKEIEQQNKSVYETHMLVVHALAAALAKR